MKSKSIKIISCKNLLALSIRLCDPYTGWYKGTLAMIVKKVKKQVQCIKKEKSKILRNVCLHELFSGLKVPHSKSIRRLQRMGVKNSKIENEKKIYEKEENWKKKICFFLTHQLWNALHPRKKNERKKKLKNEKILFWIFQVLMMMFDIVCKFIHRQFSIFLSLHNFFVFPNIC